MNFKIVKNSLKRKKDVTIILFVFICIASMLISVATNVIVNTIYSTNSFLNKAMTPHFLQMHTGEVNIQEIENFASSHDYIKYSQVNEMINIAGSSIKFSNQEEPENNSVMDNSFVTQSEKFDYLLDLNNEKIEVSSGEIAVPIYYMQERNLKLGDSVTLTTAGYTRTFIISKFVRDSQMNGSVVSSKRFLINDEDYKELINYFNDKEYLIEFYLNDTDDIAKLRNDYESNSLPHIGPTIDIQIIKLLNGLSGGIIAIITLLASILLIIITLIYVRLAICTTIEEDYREIGVLKAIGISLDEIKNLYMKSYLVLALIAAIAGYIISFFIKGKFNEAILLQSGYSDNILQYILPIVSVVLLYLLIALLCKKIFNRFNKISAVAALTMREVNDKKGKKGGLKLRSLKALSNNLSMALIDVCKNLKEYRLIFIIFLISTFIIIVPLNFLNTLSSDEAVSYMGVGNSDIRIDIQNKANMDEIYNQVNDYLSKDNDIEKYTILSTSSVKVLDSDGVWANMDMEVGDYEAFPINFLKGKSPDNENELSLSYLKAKELNKTVGDYIDILVEGQSKRLIVSGIYQDITNGGKTSKGKIAMDLKSSLRFDVYIDTKDNVNVEDKINEYLQGFSGFKVSNMKDYLNQTLGQTIDQCKEITMALMVIVVLVAILITSMFIRMKIAKDVREISIMKSIGYTNLDIEKQYILKVLIVLIASIIIGTIVANTLGELIIGLICSNIGIAEVHFIINPIIAYFACPVGLAVIVTITTILNSTGIKFTTMSKLYS